MANNLTSGVTVEHTTFGEGIVISVNRDVAEVNFLNVGKKTVLTSFLKVVNKNNEENKPSSNSVTGLTMVRFIIDYMTKNKRTKLSANRAVELVKDQYGYHIPSITILQALDPIIGIVFLSHTIRREKKLAAPVKNNKAPAPAEEEKETIFEFKPISNVDAFEKACMKEKFDSSLKLFYAREIIRYALSIKNPDQINVLKLSELAESILNVLLNQMSISYFYNDSERKNPQFYKIIFEYIQDNELSENQKTESLKMISTYLRSFLINQFLLVDGKKSDEIYQIDGNGNLIFGHQFLSLLKKKGESLDKRIVNRIKYFMSKNNDSSAQLQHYVDFFDKDQSSMKDIILKFEYEDNLSRLSSELREDLILKSDFKALMKKYGIPANENYFKMCMARIDYTLRTKRLILRNKYKTLTAYYREQALKEDIYRYSNPYNLDEYDIALKSLNYNLDIIDVGYGVYLTRTNMIRNGLTDDVISNFKEKVIKTVKKMRFMSLQELMDFLKDDKVVSYCDGDKKQLVQFVKPISAIGVNELASGSYILCVKSSKHYKGDFIEFIMGSHASMDIYDIHDSVKEHFDVEYSIEEIIRDLKYTSFYYSEEMEKVYKTKKVFVLEVFGDGH